jgi:hypothetical protein
LVRCVISRLKLSGLCGIGKLREVSHDALRSQERYHRVDLDTIEFNLKVDDPKVFTKTRDADTRILKRKPNAEILASFCVAANHGACRHAE